MKPEKHALDRTGKKVLDGKEVQLGDYIQYFLNGVTVPENMIRCTNMTVWIKLDTKHDRYNWLKRRARKTERTKVSTLVTAANRLNSLPN